MRSVRSIDTISAGRTSVEYINKVDRSCCRQSSVGQSLTSSAERHGLPQILDDWLFPDDGSTRDLATLQVSLGHHDEFFAFDKHDRISHINTELRDNASNMSNAPQTQTVSVFSRSPDGRRKSHTFSHPNTSDDSEAIPSRRSSSSRRLRPRSIAITGALSMRSWHEKKKSQEVQPFILEQDGDSQARMFSMRRPSPDRRPAYSDASVQTDILENEDFPASFSLDDLVEDPSAQRSRRPLRSHVSSISSISSLLSESSSSTNISTSSYSSTSSTYSQNPICMGAMQRYFRESQYRLGDALLAH